MEEITQTPEVVEEVTPTPEVVEEEITPTPEVVEEEITPTPEVEEDKTPKVEAEVIINNNPEEVVIKEVDTVVINDEVVPDPNQTNPGVFSN